MRKSSLQILNEFRGRLAMIDDGDLVDNPSAIPDLALPPVEIKIAEPVKMSADDAHHTETFHPLEVAAVGDVNSKEQGTGARFNQGKVPYEVLPLGLLLHWIDVHQYHDDLLQRRDSLSVLEWLAAWQAGNDDALFEALNCAVVDEGLPGFADAARVFKHVTERKVKPYPMWNWIRGMPWSVPYGCAIRHLNAEILGETHDPETNLPHRAHTICNLIMLLLYAKTYKAGDDRPPSEFL